MSCKDLLESSGQICYVQCSFCTTILLVNVPYCSTLLKMVTVRCGHCDGLLSVNMMRAPIFPLHLLASFTDEPKQENCEDAPPNAGNGVSSPFTSFDEDDDDGRPYPINKPPEKRPRAPTAYNRFIKEEIKRLKARQPSMAHKEAFSTAAKNWAHFPLIQHQGNEERCTQGEGHIVARNVITEKAKNFSERAKAWRPDRPNKLVD